MGDNKISIYKHNSVTIDCSANINLSGYSAKFTVKKEYNDQQLISVDGSISGTNNIIISLSPLDTSLAPSTYLYDLTIDNSINIYTVVQDEFVVEKSVRY